MMMSRAYREKMKALSISIRRQSQQLSCRLPLLGLVVVHDFLLVEPQDVPPDVEGSYSSGKQVSPMLYVVFNMSCTSAILSVVSRMLSRHSVGR